MKISLVVLVAWPSVCMAARVGAWRGGDTHRRGHAFVGEVASHDFQGKRGSAMKAVGESAEMEAAVARLLKEKGTEPISYKELTEIALRQVNSTVAAQRLTGMLPAEIASLVAVGEGTDSQTVFEERSLQTARSILNEMIFDAWVTLDSEVSKCIARRERISDIEDILANDIATENAQISGLEAAQNARAADIEIKNNEIETIQADLANKTATYNAVLAANQAEMDRRQDDAAVFDWILSNTGCPRQNETFLQVERRATQRRALICQASEGPVLSFMDEKLRGELERRMTPRAMHAVREILGRVQITSAKMGAGFFQQDADAATFDSELPSGGGVNCSSVPMDFTHDCMQFQSEMQEQKEILVNFTAELQLEMDTKKYDYDLDMDTAQENLAVVEASRERLRVQYRSTADILANDNNFVLDRMDLRLNLNSSFTVISDSCKSEIIRIFYQNICPYLTLRERVMLFSTRDDHHVDCEMGDWVPDGECSKTCDNECPGEDDTAADSKLQVCGGSQNFTRSTTLQNNDFGVRCRAEKIASRCNQIKCPVNCSLSDWEEWTDCSATCDGGSKTRTRTVTEREKYGGDCPVLPIETADCGAELCEINCTLASWTSWSPCSQACGLGFRERFRHVSVPSRSGGQQCAEPDSGDRYENESCNTEVCNGCVMCNATQDLIILIDGRDIIGEKYYAAFKLITQTVLHAYEDGANIAVLQFGNTADANSNPEEIIALENDIQQIIRRVNESVRYTEVANNMATALNKSDEMLFLYGRSNAQSSILTLTKDSHIPTEVSVKNIASRLKDRGVVLSFALVGTPNADMEEAWNALSSSSDGNHLEFTDGDGVLTASEITQVENFADGLVLELCPEAKEPNAPSTPMNVSREYMRIGRERRCGEQSNILSEDLDNNRDVAAAKCAALASGADTKAFLLGFNGKQGKCFAVDMKSAETARNLADSFEEDRENLECPSEDSAHNEDMDFYILRT